MEPVRGTPATGHPVWYTIFHLHAPPLARREQTDREDARTVSRIVVDRWHSALRIRFDAPAVRNAIDEQTAVALDRALAADPQAVAVLGSTDPGIFCAGADLTVDDDERRQLSDRLYQCYRTMVTRPGPVIAVVQGPAVGGGAQLTAAADLRVAGPAARWRWVGPGHGLAVGAWVLPDLVGRGRALDLLLSSRWVDAAEAAAIGLAPAAESDPWASAARLVEQVSGLDVDAIRRVKQITANPGLLAALQAERDGNAGWDGRVPRSRRAEGTPRRRRMTSTPFSGAP
jgi:enoyl-CoA hydratase/carnithine racemase